jgi:hypothetical protein
MFWWCTDRSKGLFEVGGEEVQRQEGGLVIQGSSSDGGLRDITVRVGGEWADGSGDVLGECFRAGVSICCG